MSSVEFYAKSEEDNFSISSGGSVIFTSGDVFGRWGLRENNGIVDHPAEVPIDITGALLSFSTITTASGETKIATGPMATEPNLLLSSLSSTIVNGQINITVLGNSNSSGVPQSSRFSVVVNNAIITKTFIILQTPNRSSNGKWKFLTFK